MQPTRHKMDHPTQNGGRYKLQQWEFALVLQLDIAVRLVCFGAL